MLKHHLISIIRGFLRSKMFTLIHVSGLTLGLTAVLLILQYTTYEKSFDQAGEMPQPVYRLWMEKYKNGELQTSEPSTYPALGEALRRDFPEIVHTTRSYIYKGSLLSYENQAGDKTLLPTTSVCVAEPSFLDLFAIRVMEGNPETALKTPFSLLISESLAKQLFPHESALGKVIVEDNDEPMQITGVFADRAKNTEIDFDLIKSYSSLDAHFQRLTGRETDFSHTSWDWPRIKIFLSLRDVQAEENLNSKLENYLSKQKPRSENEGITEILHLQKIEDIHMNSPLGKPFGTKTEKARQTGFMELIVWVILLIAWINFVNLSTVKALEKAKDAGIKKILGASRRQLMIQFFLESLLVNMMALFVALTIFQTILPLFNQWLGIEGNYVFLNTGYWLGGMILVVVSGALAAGYYPAFLLAASKAQDALTYHGRTARSRFPLRKGLIVAQFTI
ncbi:MAG: ABC transporter permease, partial [Bacteroidetes bacterium]|nr:ABC transporter permease [Bacteroidota bacterium]